jgi:hypothetical protein
VVDVLRMGLRDRLKQDEQLEDSFGENGARVVDD